MTEDVRPDFRHYPTTAGKPAFHQAIGDLWSRIKGNVAQYFACFGPCTAGASASVN